MKQFPTQKSIYKFPKCNITVVIRVDNNFTSLQRCLQSIDAGVEVVISVSTRTNFRDLLKEKGFSVAQHVYGNWSQAAEVGVKKARNNKIIIMDSDSYFGKNAIKYISSALRESKYIVQANINFLNSGTFLSKLIAKARTYENTYETKAYSPGLGIRRKELLRYIGIDGNVYNTRVSFADDGDLDMRARTKGLIIAFEKKAVVHHEPVGIKHEMVSAYRLGRGAGQSDGKDINLTSLIINTFFSQFSKNYFFLYGEWFSVQVILQRLLNSKHYDKS